MKRGLGLFAAGIGVAVLPLMNASSNLGVAEIWGLAGFSAFTTGAMVMGTLVTALGVWVGLREIAEDPE